MLWNRRRAQAGLTLIEVLVAMLVLGTAMAMILTLLGQHTRNLTALERNLLARIAAENAMVELTLSGNTGQAVAAGGRQEIGGQGFTWTALRTPSPLEGMDLLVVAVTVEDESRVLATLGTMVRGEGR